MSNDWQPIATAPKDGTVILVWDGAHVGAAIWEQWGRRDVSGWWVGAVHGESAEWNDMGQQPTIDPTHWMPLPDPPTD